MLLASEVSLLAAVAGVALAWPLAVAAAGAAASCGMLLLLSKALPASADRLQHHIVRRDDSVLVHVTLFDGHGVQIDSTLGGEPLVLQAGASDERSSSSSSALGPLDSSSSSSSSSRFLTGAGRMQTLAPLLEHVLPGACIGIPLTFTFRNLQRIFPDEIPAEARTSQSQPDSNLFGNPGMAVMQVNRLQVPGEQDAPAQFPERPPADGSSLLPLYVASHLVWWQPVADMKAKYKGRGPQLGDVFRYPLAGKADGWVDVQVTAVSRELMELNAGSALTGQQMSARVQVVRKVAA
ncbi:MAG: hypothetical protein WDW38_001943 [Sanguina aurantia]